MQILRLTRSIKQYLEEILDPNRDRPDLEASQSAITRLENRWVRKRPGCNVDVKDRTHHPPQLPVFLDLRNYAPMCAGQSEARY
jgi:hypothetical protein